MKYRVENIIETLKRLPEPEYSGQVLKVPVMVATWEHDYTKNAEVCNEVMQCIVVTAERQGKDNTTWLEWVYDV